MKIREPHRQIWPWLAKLLAMLVATAAARSQSANTKLGFLPPSSRLSFLNRGAAVTARCRPVAVPPVKLMALMPGCSTRACPQPGPVPCTMLRTPAGRPASRHNSPSKNAVTGVSSEGLATTQQPTAKAGAIFQVNRYSGRFQGEMQPTTPTGWRTV